MNHVTIRDGSAPCQSACHADDAPLLINVYVPRVDWRGARPGGMQLLSSNNDVILLYRTVCGPPHLFVLSFPTAPPHTAAAPNWADHRIDLEWEGGWGGIGARAECSWIFLPKTHWECFARPPDAHTGAQKFFCLANFLTSSVAMVTRACNPAKARDWMGRCKRETGRGALGWTIAGRRPETKEDATAASESTRAAFDSYGGRGDAIRERKAEIKRRR